MEGQQYQGELLAYLQSTMRAIESACASIQLANARFQAAGALRDAAIREWSFLSSDDRNDLINFCLNFVFQHAGSPEGYVQAKVSSVAAQLLKRGWLEFSVSEKERFFYQSAVVYLLLKLVVDWVDGQITHLEAQETSIVVDFCMRLLQLYSSLNIGKISLSTSSALLSDAETDKCKDLRALLQLLSGLCSKDLVDFLSDSSDAPTTNISQVVFYGLHIVTPLLSLELLKYPKLCHDYFSLLSHMLEVYPEMVGQLNGEAFSRVLQTLDFGLHHQDVDVVSMCLRALKALASYHYKETMCGRPGLGSQASSGSHPTGESKGGILSQFLQSLLHLLLFENYRRWETN